MVNDLAEAMKASDEKKHHCSVVCVVFLVCLVLVLCVFVFLYGNLTPCGSTLCVRVKRHVIHHGCIVYAQKIRGRILQEFIASWKFGREHSTYCGRNLVYDQPVSQYSIRLRTYHF